jgi:hypothetical protein
MKLIDNWRAELNKLWSIRMALLTALLGSADQILGAFMGNLPPVVYSLLAVLIAVARVVDQKPA